MKSKLKREIFILLCSAGLFFLVNYPFTLITSYFVITEVRISAVLNPCLGFVFGPSAAVGCAVGNFVCDLMTMELRVPDRAQADRVRRRFMHDPAAFYQVFSALMTGDPVQMCELPAEITRLAQLDL